MDSSQPIPSRTPKIRTFNPGRLSDEEREATFLARHQTFNDILSDILKCPSVPQHHLIIGQRGMGKSTLLCRTAAELRKAEYSDRFLPLEFPEEQYVEVDRLSRFWLNCLDGVADALDQAGKGKQAKELDKQINQFERSKDPENLIEPATRKLFLKIINELPQRLVLLIDNLNLLVGKLQNEDYSLRGFFSKSSAPILVGASVVIPEETTDYSAAFYEGLKTRVLHRLTVREMTNILITLAEYRNRNELVPRISQEKGRLTALRELTGGNPRTTVLLFELFAQGFSEDAWSDLEELLDQVTPLYQSRLDQLSDQGQLIIGSLARNWAPASRKQLVEMTRIAQGSISPQLKRLEDIGLVETVPLSNPKLNGYQIAERFFNIWYLMRFAARRQRSSLICLTRFLETFYEPHELRLRADELERRDYLSHSEYSYALAVADALPAGEGRRFRRITEINLVSQLGLDREKIAQIIDPEEVSKESWEFSELREQLARSGKNAKSVSPEEFADLVLGSWNLREARESLASRELNIDQIEIILRMIKRELIAIEQIYGEAVVKQWQNELQSGRFLGNDLEDDFKHLIKTKKDSRLLLILGKFCPNPDLSENAYLRAIKLDASYAVPWNELGNLYQVYLERYEESETAYRKAIELDSSYALPWNNLGSLYQLHSGRYEEAETAYRKAIELDSSYALPWNNLGNLYQVHLERYEEAETAFRNAIELESNPSKRNWNSLGNLQCDYLGKFEVAISSFHEAIKFDKPSPFPLYNLIFLLRDFLDRPADAREQLEEFGGDSSEIKDSALLQEVLFATREQNWGRAMEHLDSALKLVGDDFPVYTRDDWYRAPAVMIHQGYGSKLIHFLEEGGWDITFMPWFEAIHAHVKGKREYILNIPAEARNVAEKIYDEIAIRRKWLPESNRDIA